MKELVFASGNAQKFAEAEAILSSFGYNLRMRSCQLEELQTTDETKLVRRKCIDAYKLIGRALFVEHTSLRLPHLGGFPAGLTQPFLKTVGLENAVKLLFDSRSQVALGVTTIAYTDGRTITTVHGEMQGKLVPTPSTAAGDWEGFGWNQIFVPDGYSETLAKLGMHEKNKISMRRAALERLVTVLA